MHVRFIHFGSIKFENGILSSQTASTRYRAIIPALGILKLGINVSFIDVHGVGLNDLTEAINVSHLIFTKLTAPSELATLEELQQRSLAIATAARAKGIVVIADFSDNLFESKSFSTFYSRLIELSTKITVTSGVLAAVVAKRTNREVIVVADPVESDQQVPKFMYSQTEKYLSRVLPFNIKKNSSLEVRLKLLWYGHPSNVASLVDFFPNLEKFSRTTPLSLNVVSDLTDVVIQDAKQDNLISSDSLAVSFTSWSVVATWQAISDCDIVIIPTKSTHEAKRAKGPNRLIEAMWCGRFVVSSSIPAYNVFRDWAWVDDNLIDGIKWSISHPREVVARIRAAQEHIRIYHSPEVITNNWLSVLTSPTINAPANESENDIAPPGSAAKISADALKLNLGCGDKILEGYINVDISFARLGNRPNVICDLRNLSVFKSDAIDEILSVHVIEHFWRWEVDDILREWIRVLKPGGILILECPNLISACQDFLSNPSAAVGTGVEGQKSMWVFYGDPKWRDPLMVHRWGYTPESLGLLLMQLGLINVRQEPAQFKLKEPRDMRIVGEKPAATI